MSDRERLGDYVVEGLLGRGTMGGVYRARHISRDGHGIVAVKRVAALGTDVEHQRLRREADTMRRLDHPNILRVLDVVSDGTGVALVTSYADGGSLADRLRDGTTLTAEELASVIAPIADALGAAHAAGVLHRDVKPSNILFVGGQPMLADFGIARVAGDASLTATGATLGTTGYFDPELADGAEPSESSDLYALGVVSYEALAGRPPFHAPTPIGVLKRASIGDFERLDRSCFGATADVVERAMARTPTDRFPTAAAFANALRNPTSVAPALTTAASGSTEVASSITTASDTTTASTTAAFTTTTAASTNTASDNTASPDNTADTTAASTTTTAAFTTTASSDNTAETTASNSASSIASSDTSTVSNAATSTPGPAGAESARPPPPTTSVARSITDAKRRVARRVAMGAAAGGGAIVLLAVVISGAGKGIDDSYHRPFCDPATTAGCTESITRTSTGIRVQFAQSAAVNYRIGQPDDRLLLGNWLCGDRETLALYRPQTGVVYYYDAWPDPSPDVARVKVFADATGIRSAEFEIGDRNGDGCGDASLRVDNTKTWFQPAVQRERLVEITDVAEATDPAISARP